MKAERCERLLPAEPEADITQWHEVIQRQALHSSLDVEWRFLAAYFDIPTSSEDW